jgi:hypothetical protein
MNYPPPYGSLSPCHHSLSHIVRSREGGFVTQNCISCGTPRTRPADEILTISCPNCGTQFDKIFNANKNYAHSCHRCHFTKELAAIVPHWSDCFEYHGFGLDSDYENDYR